MRPAPYPVQATKLETQFDSDPECTHHVKFVSDNALNQRRIRKDEKWRREKELGHGSYGIVWLEKCIQGDDRGILRAVKKVQKPESGEYYGELDAVALFSHAKYEHCFVKSLGWYDDESSIYIAMEYLPDGDLQRYLRSPLPEEEARNIILQVLEGLQFMHDNGFTHRDLKPANILVKCKGPNWWVKITDFGISKYVIEEQTALRTAVGTPSFAAPEVLGFFRPGDRPKDSYTNAVDVWSLGVIAYLILCAETPFKDPRRLNHYVMGNIQFPSNVLRFNKVSALGCEFINSLMAPNSEDRPKVKDCFQHPWFEETAETQGEFNVSNLSSSQDYFEPEPSANWSTQSQNATHEPNKVLGAPPRKTSPLPSGTVTSSNHISSRLLTPSKSREYIDHQSFFEQTTQDYKSTHEPNKFFNAPSRQTSPLASGTVTSSNPMSGRTFTPSKSPDYVDPEAFLGQRIQDYRLIYEPNKSLNAPPRKTLPLTSETMTSSDPISRRTVTPSESPEHINPEAFYSDQRTQGYNKFTNEPGWLGMSDENKRTPSRNTSTSLVAADNKAVTPSTTIPYLEIGLRTSIPHEEEEEVLLPPPHEPLAHVDWITLGIFNPDWHMIGSVAFFPGVKLIAIGSGDGVIFLWSFETFKVRKKLKGHSDVISAVRFSSDGRLFASASHDKTVKLWDSAKMKLRHTFEGHEDGISDVAFSPDGKLVASASWDGTARLWNLATMAIHQVLKGHTARVTAISFSPDGRKLASGSTDETTRLWDLSTGMMVDEYRDHADAVLAVAFSPDGTMLASASIDKTVVLRDLVAVTLRHRLRGHEGAVRTVAFSPDGTLVLTSGPNEHSVKIWDPITGTMRKSLDVRPLLTFGSKVRQVTFSPDGNTIAAALDRNVALWDSPSRSKTIRDTAEEVLDRGKDSIGIKSTVSNLLVPYCIQPS